MPTDYRRVVSEWTAHDPEADAGSISWTKVPGTRMTFSLCFSFSFFLSFITRVVHASLLILGSALGESKCGCVESGALAPGEITGQSRDWRIASLNSSSLNYRYD